MGNEVGFFDTDEAKALCCKRCYYYFEFPADGTCRYYLECLRAYQLGAEHERTCKVDLSLDADDEDNVAVWLTCGHEFVIDRGFFPVNYCPECGAKVVGE